MFGKKILLVDDDISILKSFKRILENKGYVVETAETGRDALEKIKKKKFNAYLVDVRLPDMDGTNLLKAIKDPQTVKIIITGYSSEEVGRKAADYGADDYLVKPVKPEELLATVQERLTLK
jgi:DNA-binding response OmpR family regulator